MIRIAFCALLAASAAQADPAKDYTRDFLGLYSPAAQCLGQEFIVSLDPGRIGIGETTCQITAITPHASTGLRIELAQCRSEGEPSPNRSVTLSFTNNDPAQPLSFSTGDGTSPSQLLRCTDL